MHGTVDVHAGGTWNARRWTSQARNRLSADPNSPPGPGGRCKVGGVSLSIVGQAPQSRLEREARRETRPAPPALHWLGDPVNYRAGRPPRVVCVILLKRGGAQQRRRKSGQRGLLIHESLQRTACAGVITPINYCTGSGAIAMGDLCAAGISRFKDTLRCVLLVMTFAKLSVKAQRSDACCDAGTCECWHPGFWVALFLACMGGTFTCCCTVGKEVCKKWCGLDKTKTAMVCTEQTSGGKPISNKKKKISNNNTSELARGLSTAAGASQMPGVAPARGMDAAVSLPHSFTAVSLSTVRRGKPLHAPKTRTIKVGEQVMVLEQAQHEGRLLGRISATEWVAIQTKGGKTLLTPGASTYDPAADCL
jgi:hypothetical protein